MNQLTRIAALPGSGAGHSAALRAETVPAEKKDIETDDIAVYYRSLISRTQAGEISPAEAYRLAEEWSIRRVVEHVITKPLNDWLTNCVEVDKNGTVHVKPENSWANAPKHAKPVVLDPPVIIHSGDFLSIVPTEEGRL